MRGARLGRRLAAGALAVGMSLAAATGSAQLPAVRVGVVVDGPWSGNAALLALSRVEVATLTEGEFDVTFPDAAHRVGDWTLETARDNLERLLADPEVDVVLTWGLLASHTVCCLGALPKPVIAPVVIDARLQGLPSEGGVSGVGNLNYVSLPDTLIDDLTYFRRMVPFDKVVILTHGELLEAVPELATRTREAAEAVGIDYEWIGVGSSAAEALAEIPDDAEAVYAWPLYHMSAAEFQRLVDGLNARRLPTFSALGGPDLEAGMLASLGDEGFLPRLTRRVALNLQRILLGEDPGDIPVAFETRDRLTLNMATARAIGVSPPWELLIEADMLHDEDPEATEVRTLSGVVEEAIAANLDLAAEARAVAAGEQEVKIAEATLRPTLDLAGLGVAIDDDRAAASFGSQAERTWSAAATLRQLVYSEAARANAAVQRRLQEARRLELETARLDVTLEASVAYLNVLRAESLVQVRRNNLRATRSNVELARIRRTVGAANPAEVFRWESQVATDRKVLIEALGDLQVAEIALNRVLHRPQDTPFRAAQVSLTDPQLMTGSDRFRGYTENRRRYDAFTDFMVETGLEASPELARLDALVAAGERTLTAARRAFWAPDLGLEASYEEILSRDGAGASGAPFVPLIALPEIDDTNWSVAFRASLPLFTGGARAAERVRAEEELAALELVVGSTAERVEQRIRSAMAEAWSSFPGVELSRQAAAAARQNLDLVSDAYARGAVPIIDLLDAQAAALNADELATNSVYDFLIDLMEVERAANCFDFFLGPAGQEEWFERLDRFFDERGIPPLDPLQISPHDIDRGGAR